MHNNYNQTNRKMNIQFETHDEVYGLLTLTIEESDYADEVDKQLKEYRKRAKVDGFRPGSVPMGLVKKMYGLSAKMDVVNKLVSDQLYKYIEEKKLQMLGNALPSDKQEPQDLSLDTPHTFIFDIALAPAFEVKLSEKDTFDYYNIKVDDALIDRQVEMFASRYGSYVSVEEFSGDAMVKGTLVELSAEGAALEGGLIVEDALVMPKYVSDEEQKKVFEGAKVGDVLTLTPRKMYGDTELAALLKVDKEEALKHEGAFSYAIKDITSFKNAAVDQTLFDNVYGAGACADEAAFRQKIAEGIVPQLSSDSDFKFLSDVRAFIEKQIGELSFPETLLKRIMKENTKGEEKDEEKVSEKVEANYPSSIQYLTWHLIKEKLVAQYEVKVEEADVQAAAVEAARVQFAQYGMNNVPAEYLENYAKEMLSKRESLDGVIDRAVEVKLTAALKGVVSLNNKEVSLEEFNKLVEVK